MKMLARLNYLFAEGFEVSALSGYDDDSGEGNASITFVMLSEEGERRLCTEMFAVGSEEMEQCSLLFLRKLSSK